VVLGFAHHPGVKETRTRRFRNRICFRSQVKGEDACSVGSLERANRNRLCDDRPLRSCDAALTFYFRFVLGSHHYCHQLAVMCNVRRGICVISQ
jgi:hypothetical protein